MRWPTLYWAVGALCAPIEEVVVVHPASSKGERDICLLGRLRGPHGAGLAAS